ncbi:MULTISPECIES: sensor histidine kinase [unclassified Pseudomonas]|uniref:sensor histidine kinase n=1 Tax=unclassified Pseudomonas TaxID=196821 RepID=UPI000C88AEAE|nr:MULTISPECIES: sensor histidine kinase [unclassified Pseudomonas]PMZ95652.1 hypothetical protein C1X79_13760 [Pseudomonas sp. FW305-42]PNA24052.1 hypothetical protein C1X78_12350 [Pseudomonas sp. MPR-R1B]PNB24706.1 hypothetical protein C1X80_16385 [Pseudomonas sp. DP16D-E2]PNB42125.1 hypothetical protein C1X75_17175 [Pseudomonas sp. FW305-17]PNB58799.1 hypothetical protein C1X77_17645 [Pseudomonas sp. GW531-E2]
MAEEYIFHADAAIINRLGRELVAKQETALIELIKNCYDADATNVKVIFDLNIDGASLEIRDDGEGMSQEEIVGGFLRLASDLKVKSPLSKKYKRQRAGRKGIGRFSTQRLGEKLILSTRKLGAKTGYVLTVDWAKFLPGISLDQVPVTLEEKALDTIGTVVRIEGLSDDWSESQIRRCWRGVLALQQPFPVAPVVQLKRTNEEIDPGFHVEFLRGHDLYNDEAVVVNIETEILNYLPATVELKVDNNGHAFWKLSKNIFGETFDWRPIHHKSPESDNPPAYTYLKNTWMKSHYVILEASLLPSLVFTRIRDELSQYGGVRLYRNGFRVVPYGEPDNDWLRLDELYTRRSYLFPIANRNFFGVTEVRDVNGEMFEEHTSREGLIENPAFSELKELLSSVLVTTARKIAEDRGKKIRAGDKPVLKKIQDNEFLTVEKAIRSAHSIVEKISKESPSPTLQKAAIETANAVSNLEAVRESIVTAQEQMADEAAMLRFLATLGMTTAEFSHETGMTFDAFRLDFKRVFEVAINSESNSSFLEQASRAQAMLARLDTLTSYLNALASARSARGMAPLSLSKAVEDFSKGIMLQASSMSVSFKTKVPPYDGLFTAPMHEAELASMLLNFYTNAVKALKRSENSREIFIEAGRVDEESSKVYLKFSDSGDGIPAEHRDKVFDAFFTTRLSPAGGAMDAEHARGTGLGLWIVRQIVENTGGTVEVIDPPEGYSTCIEVILPGETDE